MFGIGVDAPTFGVPLGFVVDVVPTPAPDVIVTVFEMAELTGTDVGIRRANVATE